MKIFISHSSKDKWAARRIAKDIEELGHSVFLDEKDIATGESIDVAIFSHLKESDHFVLLLSPASLKSSWVLLELGGAMAFKKKIVPVLLYVGANEVPQVINMKLARDINEIDKYYDELGGIPKPPKAAASSIEEESTRKAKAKRVRFKQGDAVFIQRNTPKTILRSEGVNVVWIEEMDPYLGRRATITKVDMDGDCDLDIDEGRFSWAPEWFAVA